MKERYLYVFYLPEFEYYKIGFSNNVNKRYKNIETSIPFTMKKIFWMKHCSASKIESTLHYKYAAYRKKGEWFFLDYEHALECIFLALKEIKTDDYTKQYKNIYINEKWLSRITFKQKDTWYINKNWYQLVELAGMYSE